jgi:serine/threonine protein kinase
VGEVVFGRYWLIEVIGQGGMGTVHRAHDTRMQRDVAIKVLPPELRGTRLSGTVPARGLHRSAADRAAHHPHS